MKLSQPTMKESRPRIPVSHTNKIRGRPSWTFAWLLALALFKDLTDKVCQYFQILLGAAKLMKLYNKHC